MEKEKGIKGGSDMFHVVLLKLQESGTVANPPNKTGERSLDLETLFRTRNENCGITENR